MYRLVVDTNVIVSASGKPRLLLQKALFDGKYDLVTSDEIRTVLSRPKFRLDESVINGAVSLLESRSAVIKSKSRFEAVEDQDDNMFINAAFDGRADYIVSGDHHLLNLKGR